MSEAWKTGPSNPVQKRDVADTLRHYNCLGIPNFGKSIFELPLKGDRLLGFEHVDLIVDGPRKVGPINFCTGNWWVVNLEDLGVHHVFQVIGEQMEKRIPRVWTSRRHGMVAICQLWPRCGIGVASTS